MSVTGTRTLWSGQAAAKTLKGGVTYTAAFGVTTNDPDDGPLAVLQQAALPRLGNIYSIGNDFDGFAFCKSLTPRRDPATRTYWIVQAEYGPADEEEDEEDEEGNPTSDPLEYSPDVSIQHITVNRPVWKAINRTALPNRPAAIMGPVTNSAGMVLDPPLEEEHTITVLRIKRNHEDFESKKAEKYQGAINSDPVVLKFPGYRATYKPWTCKLTQMGGSLKFGNGEHYWEIETELQMDRDGWRVDVPDIGLHALAIAGDDNGEGGTYSSDDFIDGRAPVHAIKDAEGYTITEKVLLDGKGHPLKVGQPPVFITWSVSPELPFAAIKKWAF